MAGKISPGSRLWRGKYCCSISATAVGGRTDVTMEQSLSLELLAIMLFSRTLVGLITLKGWVLFA